MGGKKKKNRFSVGGNDAGEKKVAAKKKREKELPLTGEVGVATRRGSGGRNWNQKKKNRKGERKTTKPGAGVTGRKRKEEGRKRKSSKD